MLNIHERARQAVCFTVFPFVALRVCVCVLYTCSPSMNLLFQWCYNIPSALLDQLEFDLGFNF